MWCAACFVFVHVCARAPGMGGLQSDLEPLGVRRSERPADHTQQTVETGRAHVQQVSAIVSVSLEFLIIINCSYVWRATTGKHFPFYACVFCLPTMLYTLYDKLQLIH